MVKKINKMLIVTMLVIMLLPMQIIQVFATEIGETPYLKRGELGDYIVQFYNGSYWTYVSHNIVTYTDVDGTEKVAYCVTPNTPGIEHTNDGSVEGYNVNITQLLSNDELWRVFRHGYPYATPEQMGVESAQDAYLATKLAVQCVLVNRSTEDIRKYYRGGQDPVAGLKLEDITRRGNKVVDAVYNLVNYARTSNETPTNNTNLTVSKVGEFTDEGNNYYSQTYSLTSTTKMSNYTIRNITGFPTGSFTSDLNGNAKKIFNNGEKFKIMIPKSAITGVINGEMEIAAKCETYSIFYGEGPTGFQSYGLYTDPYRDLNKTVATNIIPNTAGIKIVKTDKDTGAKLSGVTFNAKYSDGTNIGTYTTDSNGIANIQNLMSGTVVLTETKTKDGYVLNNESISVGLGIGENKTVNVTNEKKKAQIKIIKVDKDNKEVKLEGVKFEVIDSKNNVVETLTTNKNGEAITKQLPIDEQYKVRETSTKNEYVLSEKVETITLKENEIKTLTFENEKKKGQIKIIKVDEDNNEIKLDGVTFEILDSKNNVVDTITTDKNGEATTKKLPIDQQYKVKETITQETYILSDEVKTVTLQENQIKTITFENEKKKGNLEVLKVDKDNNKIGIGNVEFDLYSEELQKVIGTYKTNVNGEIKVNNLRVGSYKLIEKLTNKWYNLAEDKTVEIKWNTTQKETVENELKKGQIKIIKVDKDNNEVKLAGVKFDVIDEKGNVLETITTNENGEATTSKYPIRDYEKLKLKETETLEEYVLAEETQTVVLEENQIKTITFENEVKKAQIKVIKVDKDNQEVKLKGVKFNVLDEDGNIVDTLITDENGEATTKRLPITEEYTVVETETLQEYKLTEEKQTVTLKQDEIKTLTFENEKRKGQLKIIKVDMDDNEVLLKDVKFEIKDESGNTVETLVTDENGEATTKPLAIDQKYTVVETETQKEYVLTEETKTIELTEDEIKTITFENEKIKGYVEITKVDSKTKEILQGAKFGIFNEKDNKVAELITDENGKAISELLPIGKYYLKELDTGSVYYLLNENTYEFEIIENHKIVPITIENDSVEIEVTIDKKGTTEIKPGDKVNYEFSNIGNASNVYLENFKWFDYIPTEYVRLEKMTTGTWNQDLIYDVYYKTNKSEEYVLFKEELKTTENYELDFTAIELAEDEYIVETCYEFGKVDIGFKEDTKPTMECKSFDTLEDGQTFTNYTKTVGTYFGITTEANSKWTTITHKPEEKHEIELPRTGK